MQTVDGGHHPSRDAVDRAETYLMLVEDRIEAVRFVGVSRGIVAQRIIDVELPRALWKRILGVFAGQLQQVLVAPNHRSRSGKKGAINRFVENLLNAFE